MTRTAAQLRAAEEELDRLEAGELDARAEAIHERMEQLYRHQGHPTGTPTEAEAAMLDPELPAGAAEAMARYRAGLANIEAQRAAIPDQRLAIRREWVGIASAQPNAVESVGAPITHDPVITARSNRPMTATAHGTYGDAKAIEAAWRAIEAADIDTASAERLQAVISNEPEDHHARYISAVAAPDYFSAWATLMADHVRGQIDLSDAERAAVREARIARQALNYALGTRDDGAGWPMPLQVDPSLIITGAGSVNPLRALATVRQAISKELTVVTAAQVTAGYGAEGSDVTAVTPAPAPVTIRAERGTAFVRLTFELLADYRAAASDIARLFADARDNLEAEKFVTGDGDDEPEGIVTGLTATDDFPADADAARAAQATLGARYQPGARWLANLASINALANLVASADADDAQIVDAAGNLLRKPMSEASYMPASSVIYGDIRAGFAIVDRLGMSVEPTGVTFNASTGVPDGHRGYLAIWRSGSGVVDAAALKLFQTGS